LSYTKFQYSNLRLEKKVVDKQDKVIARVEITNIGKMTGEEIVQLYVTYPGTRIDRPFKDLKAFTKLALEPGQTKTATLEFNARELAFYDAEKGELQIENIEYTALVGPSSSPNDLKLKDNFLVLGI
jgi:beta-glucosidase